MYEIEREKALVQQAQKGNHQAIGKLYDGLFPGVYAYTRLRLPTTADAEDIVSDAFLAVVARLSHFQWKHPGSFRAWVFRIIRNHIANFYRGKGHHDQTTLGEKTNLLSTHSSILEDSFIQDELRAYLLSRIKRLSPRQQEVLLLKYFGGLRNNEIALTLALDERTVSAYLSRALAQLHDEARPNLEVIA